MNILNVIYSVQLGLGYTPNIVCFISAILYMSYYILDCLDGKQARRLKVGSSLGYIMDHNLDSFSLVLMTLSSINIMQVDHPYYSLLVYLFTSVPFFLANWEEYETDMMDLPAINGIDEGAFLMTGLFLITSFIGGDYWKQKINLFGNGELYTLNHSMSFIVLSITLLYCLIK